MVGSRQKEAPGWKEEKSDHQWHKRRRRRNAATSSKYEGASKAEQAASTKRASAYHRMRNELDSGKSACQWQSREAVNECIESTCTVIQYNVYDTRIDQHMRNHTTQNWLPRPPSSGKAAESRGGYCGLLSSESLREHQASIRRRDLNSNLAGRARANSVAWTTHGRRECGKTCGQSRDGGVGLLWR